MRPIRFSCSDTLALAPADIAGRILDLANWTDFKGYAVLPGIRAAEYEVRTPGVVGSRIRVTNTDGSSHVEEIVEWEPGRSVRLRMNGFPVAPAGISLDHYQCRESTRKGRFPCRC